MRIYSRFSINNSSVPVAQCASTLYRWQRFETQYWSGTDPEIDSLTPTGVLENILIFVNA